MLALAVQIDTAFQVAFHGAKMRELGTKRLILLDIIIPTIDDYIPFKDHQECIVAFQFRINGIQIVRIAVLSGILIQCPADIFLGTLCQPVEYLHGIAGEEINRLRQPILFDKGFGLIIAKHHGHQVKQHHRYNGNGQKCYCKTGL